MAIGWLALLKGVPWAGVISTAPLVAEGAKQLWKAVSRKPALPESAVRPDAPHATGIAALEARVLALEAGMDDLHAQMIKSSELIKVLADQNAQLVERVETQRVRLLGLSGAIVVMAIVVLAMVLLR